jgi:hypothetical protein
MTVTRKACFTAAVTGSVFHFPAFQSRPYPLQVAVRICLDTTKKQTPIKNYFCLNLATS